MKAFVRMNEYNGCYKIEAYRKLTDTEKNMISKKENINRSAIWNMVRVGIIKSFDSRIEAENAALELCESICKEFNM